MVSQLSLHVYYAYSLHGCAAYISRTNKALIDFIIGVDSSWLSPKIFSFEKATNIWFWNNGTKFMLEINNYKPIKCQIFLWCIAYGPSYFS